ncbi:MAG: pilus assembly protein [Vitreoscilla sp.]
MKTTSFARSLLRLAARLALPLSLCGAFGAAAQSVDLADKPLFSTTSVPGNLLLSLSVEYPTANSSAYFSTSAYAAGTTYLGYFDGAKCYQYVYDTTTPAASYFKPKSLASSHTCSSASQPLWSGNWLNYASMQGLDIFRWVLTGGNRTVDTSGSGGMTVLQRSTHSGQGGSGDAPNKSLSSTDEGNATPMSFSGGLKTRVWGAGIKMWFTSTANIDGSTISDCSVSSPTSPCALDYNDSLSLNGGKVYSLYMNVQVCDTSVSLEANCVLYGSGSSATYKPEGLMQQYSQTLRYGAVGYLNDSNALRDGGVLRARMAYIAPLVPVPGAAAATNPNPEWDSGTGVMAPNPDPADATATNTFTGGKVSIANSGVMNYLNKFGYTAAALSLGTAYKTYDPVGELYYASLRYLKGQSNVSSYTDMTGASTNTVKTWVDGFPVITDWTSQPAYDPILYSCQKNFILGIGDVNTHRDGNLPNSSLTASEPSMPTEVTADAGGTSPVNVTKSTTAVGVMEGTSSSLGTSYVGGDLNTYYMAGLAYDAHLPLPGKGIRSFTTSGVTTISTVSTYWLDVQEYQTYVNNNVYYYATKYGGFTVPDGYTYGTVPTLTSWYNTTNKQGSQRQPDNYFTASNATQMKNGLTDAFAKIAKENTSAYGTSLSLPTPNVTTTGAISYATTYDPKTWTGQVLGSSVAFALDGTPTATLRWDAAALLSATSVTASTRKIVTCCTTSTTSPGLRFTNAALTGATLNSRTYYASFANVPGVAAASQSIANYILYLRGDTSQEIANSGAYRTRASRLGDIVNSKPVTVGAPAYQFYDTFNPGYAAFKAKYASRSNVVYAGSNDGMVHAFDGTIGNSTSGSELFAYIPSFVYGNATTAATQGLASLGNPSFTHHYLVDATPGEFDVDFAKTSGASGAPDWHTLLIGGLGKGGKGYYALDVTDPTTWTDEATVATKVLWEFTDSRMGYSYGTPTVVKTKKYGWVVILTSGYNNSDGMGYVFFLNAKTGALLETVSTPTGSGTTAAPLNLGPQSAYVSNYTDQTADAIYAGDLQGNVWRVDVSATDTTLPYPTATKIAAFGSSQPITTRPLIEVVTATNTRYLLVGTGKLMGDSDISSSAQQSFYAIVDGLSTFGAFYGSPGHPLPTGVTFPVGRSQLNNDTSLLTGIGSSPGSVMGWYYDLPVTSGIASRVNVDPFADQGVVVFIGNTPNGSACSPSGTGAVYGVEFANGKTVLTVSDTDSTPASQAPLVGLGTDNTVYSKDGNLGILADDNHNNIKKPSVIFPSTITVKQINWRDVPVTN